VPSWQPLTVACEDDGVDLFRFTDAPILERLGQYRVEVDA
jgi:gentisate 1,2-dioxygenase